MLTTENKLKNIIIKYLKKQKYTILEENYKCKYGNIDIIAYDNLSKELVFIKIFPFKSKNDINLIAKYYKYLYGIEDIPYRYEILKIGFKKGKYKVIKYQKLKV